jgi:hypothetical protein
MLDAEDKWFGGHGNPFDPVGDLCTFDLALPKDYFKGFNGFVLCAENISLSYVV